MTSNVAEFYRNKNVFLTGGTGFVGIAIIEKLLRTSPNESENANYIVDTGYFERIEQFLNLKQNQAIRNLHKRTFSNLRIGNIYVLMRAKRGKTVEERLKQLIKNEVFEILLKQQPKEIFDKVIPIEGDVGEENLGISPENRALLVHNVNVVLHSAATLDFHESLKPTVQVNLLGTRRIMELSAEINDLHAVVHVSSAYVNSFKLECDEILYPAPDDAEKIIKLASTLSEEALNEIQPTVLGDHPNTYTFTKHLAEHEVAKCASRFPCGIVRPSMINAAWKEPIPGWTNSKNGPQGFFMGASKGVIRRLPVGTNLIYDYIPLDMVVNQVLVTAYHVNRIRSSELTIFHCTSSTVKPFRWEGVEPKVNAYLHKYPLKSAVWYPHLKFMSSLFLFKISAILFHFIPAYILDGVTRLSGGRPILVRLHTNVWSSLKLLEKFIFTEWKFNSDKTKALIKSMSDADKLEYNIDITDLDWEVYFDDLVLGVRKYLNKEDISTLEPARGKDTLLMILHLLLQLFIYSTLWWLTSLLLGVSMTKCGLVVPLFYVLFSYL